MTKLFDELLQAIAEGKEIKIEVSSKSNLSKEDAICRLRRPTILYYKGPTGCGLKDARYVFDFFKNEWEKQLEIFPNSKETGQIPNQLTENFLEKVWPICNLPKTVYCTESKRIVPASNEERYIFQSDSKSLTWFRTLLYTKTFEWIAETDIAEPYCILTTAFTELLTGLGI